MNKRKAIRRAIYITPLPGGRLIFLAAFIMLVWAVWECSVRIDAMDGMTEAYIRLVKQNSIPLKEAVKTIWETPEARKDWLNPLYLALIALFSVFCMIFRRKWYALFPFLPACVAIVFYQTSDSVVLNLFNLFETVKFASAAGLVFGGGLNAYAAYLRRRMYLKRLAERRRLAKERALHAKKQKRLPAPVKASAKTMIPKRTRGRSGSIRM